MQEDYKGEGWCRTGEKGGIMQKDSIKEGGDSVGG